MKIKEELLVIGHTALDYIITLEKFPIANTAASIETLKEFYGGAAANVAIVGATIGLKTSLVSAIGKKFIDSDYHNKMKKLKINTESMIISEDENTPTAFVLTDDNDDQIFYFYMGAGKKFKTSEVPIKDIKRSEIIHLATGDPDFNRKSSMAAKDKNKIVSFDPGQDLHLYNKENLKEILENCDILFGNHHEINRIQEDLGIDIKDLQKIGPKIITKTCGKNGSIIYNNDEKIKIDSIYRPAIDPTGAGDSYRAGFLYAYLNDKDLVDCAKFASSVSSFIVEKEGCQTNIPSYNQVKDRMDKYYGN